MSGVIYVIQNERKLIRMEQTAYTREEDFQQLLEQFPELLAGEQINSADPRKWLFVSREVPIPSELDGYDRWALDHLFLDQDAIPTLVEVKRKSDTRLRREVVGQMFDYAANAVVYWPKDEMQRQFVLTCEKAGKIPQEELSRLFGNLIDYVSFWKTADFNLKQGNVRLILVADYIPPELQRVIEFLNERMSPTEVLGVEIRQYIGGGLSTHIPRVLGQTGEVKIPGLRRTWDEASFFEDAAKRLSEEQIWATRQLYEFSKQNAQIGWGTGNARGSFNPRFLDVSRRSPFTVWSDGTLYIKPSWLDDSAEAVQFRKIYQSELEKVGIVMNDKGEKVFGIIEWSLWLNKLILATQEAIKNYKKETQITVE
jgi:hypothetical protein